jgi:hypothetical protein
LKQRIKFSAKKQKIGGEQNGNLRTEKYSNRQKKKPNKPKTYWRDSIEE